MIHATRIHKSFGKLKVLKGIDIDVKKGEIVSIIGKSGAGKTTLLQILGTLLLPDKTPDRQLIIGGQNVFDLKEKQLAQFRNRAIGFVFQFHQLLPEFSAIENICLPAYIGQIPKKKAEKKAMDLLNYLGLEDRAKHKPSELSGGEQQRVAVARALINNPKVVFADEPSGNLDSKNTQELHQLFFSLRKEFDQTFVIITHNKEFAAIADRKIQLSDGIIK